MKKRIVAIMVACALTLGASTVAYAAEQPDQAQPTSVSIGAQPYADVIVPKYRIYQDKLQKRRWNETRGYWVDPYWITIGVAV